MDDQIADLFAICITGANLLAKLDAEGYVRLLVGLTLCTRFRYLYESWKCSAEVSARFNTFLLGKIDVNVSSSGLPNDHVSIKAKSSIFHLIEELLLRSGKEDQKLAMVLKNKIDIFGTFFKATIDENECAASQLEITFPSSPSLKVKTGPVYELLDKIEAKTFKRLYSSPKLFKKMKNNALRRSYRSLYVSETKSLSSLNRLEVIMKLYKSDADVWIALSPGNLRSRILPSSRNQSICMIESVFRSGKVHESSNILEETLSKIFKMTNASRVIPELIRCD